MDDGVEKLTKTEVKALGFSDGLIESLLPEPELRDNPFYRFAGAPMKLWRKDDVERAMETEEFKEHLKKHEKRSQAAWKAAKTRRMKTMKHVEELIAQIRVQDDWTEEEIRDAARRSHNEREVARGNYGDLSFMCTDKPTVDRWMVNFVRHELTDYDYELYDMKGMTGASEAHDLYHDAVLSAIAKAYPFLKKEYNRQKIGSRRDIQTREEEQE